MATATLAPAAQIPAAPTQPDPEAVRAHVRQLHEDGGSYNRIAAAAGLDSRTVRDLISGRRPVTPYTTTVLLAVTTATLPRNRVDAGGTRLRLRALHVMGHGSPRIARAVGASAKTIRRLVRGDTTTITPQLRDAITAVYDAWWDKRAPARTPAERARGHRRPQTRHHRELVRRRRPRRRPARHPRLPALLGLETRHRHRNRPRHLPARTPAEGQAMCPTTNA